MEQPKKPLPKTQRNDKKAGPIGPWWLQARVSAPQSEVSDYFKEYDWTLLNEYRHVIELERGIRVEGVAQHFPKMLMFTSGSYEPSPKLSQEELASATIQLIEWS